MKSPYFSVIIPTLNEEVFLPPLLNDLAAQTVSDFEVIVADGHSEDKTATIVQTYTEKIPIRLLNSSERNVSTQRNLGAKKSKGKYLIFLDADDRLPPYFLEGLRYKINVTGAKVFTTWQLPDTDSPAEKVIATAVNVGLEAMELLRSPGAPGAMIGCEKKLFQKIGGFNPNTPFAEDAEFVRLAFKEVNHFHVFREPKYTFSFRRFRADGTLKLLQKYAKLHLKNLMKSPIIQQEEYPMGGHVFQNSKQSSDLFSKTQAALRKGAQNPKIARKLRAVLNWINEFT